MALLPTEFADLEPYTDWVLATEPERYAKRLASTMPDMQKFYDAAFPPASKTPSPTATNSISTTCPTTPAHSCT